MIQDIVFIETFKRVILSHTLDYKIVILIIIIVDNISFKYVFKMFIREWFK